MKSIIKVLVFVTLILIGITPLFFAGVLATKTKLQAISIIKQLPENSLMYIGIAIAFCCTFVIFFGVFKLFSVAKNKY